MAKVLLVCGTTFCLNVFLKPQINDLLKLGHEVHVYTDGEDVDSDIDDKIEKACEETFVNLSKAGINIVEKEVYH